VNSKLKLFFDENISSILANELFEFYKTDYPQLSIKHLRDFTRADSKDPVWIELLSKEPGWIVISADRGINSKPSEKLPMICKQYSISLIMLTSAAQKRGKAEQKQIIVNVWSEIVKFSELPAGSSALLGGTVDRAFLRVKHS
jgi:PIN like domain